MSVLMILCAFAMAERGWQQTLGEHVTGNSGKKCVVIDAGHGGNDPGKIGVDDSREKDLNLVIADKVKSIKENAALEYCVKNLIDEIDEQLSNNYKVLEGTSDTLYVKERSTGKHLEIKVTELAD